MYWVICAFDCLRAAWYDFKNMRGEIGWNGFVAIVRFTSFMFALLQSLLPLFAGLFLLAVSPNEYGVSLYLIYYIIIGRFRTSKIQYSYKSSFVGVFAKCSMKFHVTGSESLRTGATIVVSSEWRRREVAPVSKEFIGVEQKLTPLVRR